MAAEGKSPRCLVDAPTYGFPAVARSMVHRPGHLRFELGLCSDFEMLAEADLLGAVSRGDRTSCSCKIKPGVFEYYSYYT